MVLHLFLFLFLFIPSVSFLQLLPTLKTLQILQNQYKIYPPNHLLKAFPDRINQQSLSL